jgi:predicted ATPase
MCRTPSANAAPLLLVGGYRDNEVTNAAHPLWLFLDEIRNKGVASNTILLEVTLHARVLALAVSATYSSVFASDSLQPLELVDVNKMVNDVLHCTGAHEDGRTTKALSALVYEKTKGNPFFTISFLTKLHQTGFIVRAPFTPSAPLRSPPLPELRSP